jgi:hypothetical protein
MITCGRTALVLVVLALAGSACTSSSPVDSATAPSLIGKSYDTFFDMADGNVDAKVAVVQEGHAVVTGIMTAVDSRTAFSALGATITNVKQLTLSSCESAGVPTPCAELSYQILTQASSGLLSPTGYATYRDGKWLVAETTACQGLELFYEAIKKPGRPPGCA